MAMGLAVICRREQAGRPGRAFPGFPEVFPRFSRVPELFSEPGEQQHVDKRLPKPQPLAGRCSSAAGEAGRWCGPAAASLPAPHPAL